MPTVVTRGTSVDAPVEVVIEVLSDARQLPHWAPAFARRVRLEGDHWVAESADGARTPVTMRSSPQFGTIDVLVTEAPPIGAYMRAIGKAPAANSSCRSSSATRSNPAP